MYKHASLAIANLALFSQALCVTSFCQFNAYATFFSSWCESVLYILSPWKKAVVWGMGFFLVVINPWYMETLELSNTMIFIAIVINYVSICFSDLVIGNIRILNNCMFQYKLSCFIVVFNCGPTDISYTRLLSWRCILPLSYSSIILLYCYKSQCLKEKNVRKESQWKRTETTITSHCLLNQLQEHQSC